MIHSAKEAKSEAQNPKFETISKLQIQTFQTSFLISFICCAGYQCWFRLVA